LPLGTKRALSSQQFIAMELNIFWSVWAWLPLLAVALFQTLTHYYVRSARNCRTSPQKIIIIDNGDSGSNRTPESEQNDVEGRVVVLTTTTTTTAPDAASYDGNPSEEGPPNASPATSSSPVSIVATVQEEEKAQDSPRSMAQLAFAPNTPSSTTTKENPVEKGGGWTCTDAFAEDTTTAISETPPTSSRTGSPCFLREMVVEDEKNLDGDEPQMFFQLLSQTGREMVQVRTNARTLYILLVSLIRSAVLFLCVYISPVVTLANDTFCRFLHFLCFTSETLGLRSALTGRSKTWRRNKYVWENNVTTMTLRWQRRRRRWSTAEDLNAPLSVWLSVMISKFFLSSC